jgi:hypothetical protein
MLRCLLAATTSSLELGAPRCVGLDLQNRRRIGMVCAILAGLLFTPTPLALLHLLQAALK